MYKYIAVVQARMGSKRMPAKVMADLCGRPVIERILERLNLSKKADGIIVATTMNESDDLLCNFLAGKGIDFFRGDEDDVLKRYYQVSRLRPAYAVIRVTADNPLVDPKILDETIEFFEKGGYRYARTKGFPTGIGAEVFTTELLEEAYMNAKSHYEREHVTPYMYTLQKNVGEYTCGGEYAELSLTMDTKEDYEYIKDIYEHLYKGVHDFFLEDIIGYISGSKAGGYDGRPV